MLLITILIRLDSPGPVIFRQRRVGLDRRRNGTTATVARRRGRDLGGRPFTIYKFRTMYTGAERDSGPIWARSPDDRATRVGRVLRRMRLDELPQFWNVLRGDMSVVGPRPERPEFVVSLLEEIEGYRIRHRVRPGITGWAQVNRGADRSTDDVRAKLAFDVEYVARRSLRFDLQIMLRTLPVLLEGVANGGPPALGPECGRDQESETGGGG